MTDKFSITPEIEAHLRDISKNLPVVQKGPVKRIYKKIPGNQLTNRQIKEIRVANKFEADWKPNPKHIYNYVGLADDSVNHFENLIKEYRIGGSKSIDSYRTSVKNIKAIQDISNSQASHK